MNSIVKIDVPVPPPLDPDLFVDVDLFGQAIKADPSALFIQWADKPPFYVKVDGHIHAVLCQHDQVQWALTHPEIISSEPQKGWGADQFDYFNGLPLVLDYDPPEHSRMRRLMAPGFTPKRIASFRTAIDTMVKELIDEMTVKGQFDLVEEFAAPLMYGLLLGGLFEFPRDVWPVLINMSNAMALVATVSEGAPKPAAYMEAYDAAYAFCGNLIEERRNAPPMDDLVGSIIKAHDDEGLLSTTELFSTLVQLFTGGLGTVIATSSNCILRLLRHPDQLQLLRDNPNLLNQAIEECLRIDSLGNFRHRFVIKDHIIDGVPIYRGMIVHLSLGAANYDPAKYPDPARFDIMRNPRDILTFGYGPHFCPGNVLARSVLRAAVGQLITRFPNLRLADPNETIVYGGMPTERFPLHVNLRVD